MRGRYTILLVEDNSDDVFLVRLALKGVAVRKRVVLIPDGERAVQYLSGAGEYGDRRRFPLPDLVLLDLGLRRLSGFEVLEWIRRDASFNLVPVVVLTTSVYSEDVARAYKLGANSFVTKPTDVAEFTGAVREIVNTWLISHWARLGRNAPRTRGGMRRKHGRSDQGEQPLQG